MRATLDLDAVGSSVAGRYEVEELLGRGGMGAVFRVRDTRSGELIALKRSFARDPVRARKRRALLEREYHTLAQLAHPRIIEVFDYGVDERGPYYTMELLAGSDLTGRGHVPWKDACALLRDVASSLAILHSRGLIHRDVSTRNVRSGATGHAKLFDFGAMVSMGAVKDVAGTPPFVPPEAMQMQALDARVDLFSLGALGYFLLTGRHAYPARTLGDLRDAWRSTPAPPARFVAELPPALNLLIMQLLSLDRNVRPQSAVDVMKRLCLIAGLREEEQGAVSRAYLIAPSLVGRDKALLTVRKTMLSLVRGDGGSLLIDAPSGSGRSRMLDACVLEAKLIGALVVRADANDGASGEWGVARTLCMQLIDQLPAQARSAMRLSRDVLGHVIEGVREESSTTVPLSGAAPEHNLLIRELRDFVLALCQQQRMVIAVDDADRIDESSAALLAALAHKSERNALMIALCVDSERKREDSASLRLLRMVSGTIALPPLEPEQTESLLRSVFGDAAHLGPVASRVHALAQGSPRWTMELAQHLVSKQLARYEDGAWSLPRQLDERDLPNTLAASLAQRLDELSADARALCEALCLCDGDGLTIASYPGLSGLPDPFRMFAALDELVAARVLIADADRYRFSQRGFLSVVEQAMPLDRRARVHGRLAELIAQIGGDVLARAHHLLHAEREREAIALLCSTDLLSRLPPLPLLELAVERAERLGLSARELYRLRIALLSRASLALAARSFRRAAPAVLVQLEQDSGLRRYRELEGVPESSRLSQALTETQQRFLATPEHERVLSFVDAIRELARLIGVFCSMSLPTFDLELLESLPSIEPLKPLSPALGLIDELLVAGIDWMAGRRRGLLAYRRVLARISEPDRAGLDEVQHARTRLGVIYTLGLLEAAWGIGSAEQHAQVLEQERELRANAWRVRMTLHLAQGNAAEARKCQRRAELLQLQDGIGERYLGSGVGFSFEAHSQAGDMVGVEESLRGLEELTREHPGWMPLLINAKARRLELQGNHAAALDVVMEGFQRAQLGRHPQFAVLAATRVRLLAQLGRAEEAVSLAREYIAACKREDVGAPDHHLWVASAFALSCAGQHDEAVVTMDAAVAEGETLGRRGLALGALYEARARIAIRARDRAGFERAAERCAHEYALARNPALSLKFAALLAEAQQNDLAPLAALSEAQELAAVVSQQNESEYATVQSRMAECIGAHDRARCALTILLQSLDSFAGYLFGVSDGRLSFLAGLPEGARDSELDEWAAACLEVELDAAGNTASATIEGGSGPGEDAETQRDELATRFVDQEGRAFEPLLLISEQSQPQRAAALLLVSYPTGPRTLGNRALLAEIADLLLEHADVTGSVV